MNRLISPIAHIFDQVLSLAAQAVSRLIPPFSRVLREVLPLAAQAVRGFVSPLGQILGGLAAALKEHPLAGLELGTGCGGKLSAALPHFSAPRLARAGKLLQQPLALLLLRLLGAAQAARLGAQLSGLFLNTPDLLV